ncbi:cadherin-23-like [Haliotis cracherodii]|uniref:cadherin-23-like n=1 Tax=Haliotis cracherodii TaxID=6455 RepID=UPI0039E95146
MNFILLVAVLYCIHEGEANVPPIIIVQSLVQVSEDTPPGSVLFNISASDDDRPPVLDIRSAEVSHIVRLENITVDGNTRHASVLLNNRLDRETDGSTKALTFFASDGIYEVSARVTLIIVDVNDEKPVFTQTGYRVTVMESAKVNSTTTTVTAQDPDSGIGGHVYYGLKAKGQNADDYKYTFYVDPRHGHIIQNESLDYEKRTFYQYDVQAWDANPDESLGENHADPVDFFVTVQDVQDTSPVFTNLPYIRQVYENATLGTSVLLVQAFDGDIGVPNDLNYWIVDDNAAYTDNLTMNNESGLIETAQPLDTDSDDMKQKGGVLSFQVNASEIVTDNQTQGGDASTVTHVTVTILDVNDNCPKFSSSIINATVLENTPVGVPLSIEGVIEVKDIDMTVDNNMFELSVEQNGSPYMDFDTIPGRGEPVSRTNVMLRVNNTQVLDYEQHDNISFQIVARESRTQEKRSSTVDVLVHIIDTNDNSPVFNDTYNFNISEDALPGEIVGDVTATDSDSGDFGKVFYLMEDENADFIVSKADGVITVATKLDRETKSSYSLLVMAYDNEADVNGRRSEQTRVEIRLNDVNDNHPTFEPKPVATPIAEDIDNGTIVTTVSARDADEGMSSQIEYYIADGGNLTGRFNVDNGTGEVAVVASLIGFTGTRVLTVGARDKGEPPLNGTLQIVFSVKDVNLHPPYFNHPGGNYDRSNPFILEVNEEQHLHSEMFILEADDEDKGENGQVVYRIEPSWGDDWTFFFLDTTSGNLSNTKILDRETRPTFTIDVSAQDQGTPELKTTLPLLVRLLDIDDNDPYFPNRKHDIIIAEEETECDDNLSLADDKDEGEINTRRCYYMHSGDQPHATYFSLNKTTGTLCLNHKLDREEKDLINLIIKVSKDCSLNESPQNPFHPPFNQSDTSLLHVEVHVEDINDNPPVFKDGGELFTGILYDANKGDLVYDLKIDVTDKDIGSNATTHSRDRGQNVHGISGLETTKPFIVDINGRVFTDTLFSSSMLGHVEIAIQAYDEGDKHTADATLKVYIISNVNIIFHSLPEGVQKIKSIFISELEQLLKYRVIVDKIATHENPDKTTDDTKTDMFVHALYNNTMEVVPATELWRAFDFTIGVAELFQRYKISKSPVSLAYTTTAPLRKLMVTCDSRDFKVTVPRDMIQQVFPGSSEYDLTLDDPSCRGQVYYDVVMFRSNILGCGMTREETGSDIVYKNRIVTQSRGYYGSTTMGSIITRFNSKDISLECHLNRDVSIVGHFRPQHDHELVVRGSGNFSMHMDFYRDPSFSYRITSYPIYIGLNQDVYVDVGLESDDSELKISLQNCVAKPSVNPYDFYNQYYLIRNGCPADQTVAFEYTSSQKHVQFRFRTFEFVRNNRDVYIFCYVRVCNGTDYDQRCRRDCYSPHRQGRDVSDDRKDHDLHIFQGPLTFREKRNADFQVAEPTDEKDSSSAGTVPAIVMFIAAVAMVMAAVVMDGSTKALIFFDSDVKNEVSARVTLIILDVDDDSLDNNEVDNDGPANIETVDEQEVTMRIDEYDAMRTMIRNPALDDVLRHHADMEKTRAKEDKQSLIDDDGSDADSGT